MKIQSLFRTFLGTVFCVTAFGDNSLEESPFTFFACWEESDVFPHYSCMLTNETDEDWFVHVDEYGIIRALFDDSDSMGYLGQDGALDCDFREINNIFPDGLWLQRLCPKSNETCFGLNGLLDHWIWPIESSYKRKGVVPVRAVNWNRWIGESGGSTTNELDVTNDDGLQWRLDLIETNLVLSVENISETPRLIHVCLEDMTGRSGKCIDTETQGPFLLSANIQIGQSPNLRQIVLSGRPVPRGIYRVLHGRSASEVARSQTFVIGAVSPTLLVSGTKVHCDLHFYPFIIHPFGDWGGTNRTVNSRQRGFHLSLSTNLVIRLKNVQGDKSP